MYKVDEGTYSRTTSDESAKGQEVNMPKRSKRRSGKKRRPQESGPEIRESGPALDVGPIRLNDSYGETRVVLLPVGPYVVHVYWEVASGDLERARETLGDDFGRTQPILRFYDVTNTTFDGSNAHVFFDTAIDLHSKNCYVDLWSPEKSYFVELGFISEDGRFLQVARSNVVDTPRAWPTEHGSPVPGGEAGIVRPVGSPENVTMKADEHGSIEMNKEFSLTQEWRLAKGLQGQHEKPSNSDLTAINEKELALGISSASAASARGEDDS